MRRFFLLLALGLHLQMATAQVVITPMPHQEGYFALEDLWRVSLINPSQQTLKAQLEVELENAQHHLILRATSPVFNVLPGANRPAINLAFATSQFGTIPTAGVLRSTGRLPYGNYILCYRLLDVGAATVVGQYCQEETVKPFSPPELISPFNGEEITTLNPLLVWKPPFPPGTTPFEFTIRLVEVESRQHPVVALERNQPLLSQRGIFANTMMYPGYVPKLETGKTYAWQVSARVGDFELGATEVWVFKVVETPEMMSMTPEHSFRELQLQPNGSYNPSEQNIKFKFDNRMNAPALKYGVTTAASLDTVFYRIYPVGDPSAPITLNSSSVLVQGVNKLTIDLQSATGLNDGDEYILVLCDLTRKRYFLEFKYFD